jgi:hypothetical protein
MVNGPLLAKHNTCLTGSRVSGEYTRFIMDGWMSGPFAQASPE